MRFLPQLVLATGLFTALGAAEKALDPAAITTFRPYPLEKCVVSDEALGSMGESSSFVYDGQEITICCKGCIKKFAKQPAVYVAKLQKLEAAAAAKPAAEKATEAGETKEAQGKMDHGNHAGHDHH